MILTIAIKNIMTTTAQKHRNDVDDEKKNNSEFFKVPLSVFNATFVVLLLLT